MLALGRVIVKSSHLHDTQEIDYAYGDTNEVRAIAIAKDLFKNTIRVPEIHLAGKVCGLPTASPHRWCSHFNQIHGRQVLVQERLPGLLYASHGHTSRKSKSSPSKNRHEKYFDSCIPSSLTLRAAHILSKTRPSSATAGLIPWK